MPHAVQKFLLIIASPAELILLYVFAVMPNGEHSMAVMTISINLIFLLVYGMAGGQKKCNRLTLFMFLGLATSGITIALISLPLVKSAIGIGYLYIGMAMGLLLFCVCVQNLHAQLNQKGEGSGLLS